MNNGLVMENLSLWLMVAATWILILASYFFPDFFTPLMVFLLLTVLVFSIVANWMMSEPAEHSRRRSTERTENLNHRNVFQIHTLVSSIFI